MTSFFVGAIVGAVLAALVVAVVFIGAMIEFYGDHNDKR